MGGKTAITATLGVTTQNTGKVDDVEIETTLVNFGTSITRTTGDGRWEYGVGCTVTAMVVDVDSDALDEETKVMLFTPPAQIRINSDLLVPRRTSWSTRVSSLVSRSLTTMRSTTKSGYLDRSSGGSTTSRPMSPFSSRTRRSSTPKKALPTISHSGSSCSSNHARSPLSAISPTAAGRRATAYPRMIVDAQRQCLH
ncbi:MAG: hypothetical protein GY733_18940 [bacterium]|nr:hypothetical protein [bacterium]